MEAGVDFVQTLLTLLNSRGKRYDRRQFGDELLIRKLFRLAQQRRMASLADLAQTLLKLLNDLLLLKPMING